MEFGRKAASYYDVLGVGSRSSSEEIRRAYRKLAMRWHPDKWATNSSLLGEAKLKFQQIQEAYSVLSDQSKRTLYDAGLYDPNEEEEEGFSDFVQEMMSLMAKVKREGKTYSLEELQGMLTEMSQGFECASTNWYFDKRNGAPSHFDGSAFIEEDGEKHSRQRSKRPRWDVNSSGLGLMSGYCN